MKYVLLAAVLFQAAYSKCPNGCNGHGTCNQHDQCTCFKEEAAEIEFYASDANVGGVCFKHKTSTPCEAEASVPGYTCKYITKDSECKRIVKDKDPNAPTLFPEWQGADCSRRTCPRSTSWVEVGAAHKVGAVAQTYICSHRQEIECSDQGLCDTATGLCECFPGFTGSACQRTECPDDCSGHGTCRSNKDFAYDFGVAKSHQLLLQSAPTEFKENYIATYDDAWDSGHLYGCRCDKGYRGANCALVECPSSNDPLDDKCSKEEDAETVEDFQVQKFAPTGSNGWQEAYVVPVAANGKTGTQLADLCVAATTKLACDAVKHPTDTKLTCTFIPAGTNPITAARCEQTTPWPLYAPGDKNNHFYNGKVYACFGAMSGMDCSGRGICDYTTGQCACFSGYSGTSCSKIEELV